MAASLSARPAVRLRRLFGAASQVRKEDDMASNALSALANWIATD
jgi:hypothetical protein